MGWSFDETNDHVELADDAALTLPNGDWTIGGWVNIPDNTGTIAQFVIGWGNLGATPSFSLLIKEVTGAANADKLTLQIVDDGGADTGVVYDTGFSFSDHVDEWLWVGANYLESPGNLYLIIMDRASKTFRRTAVKASFDLDAINPATVLKLGVDGAETGTRRFGGKMAEFAKWNRLVTQTELESIRDGASPRKSPGIQWFVPMLENRYEELIAQIVVTNDGTTPANDHPPHAYRTRFGVDYPETVATVPVKPWWYYDMISRVGA